MDGLTDKVCVFIPAKLLSYMTGIELAYRHGLHRSSMLAEAGVVVEEREVRQLGQLRVRTAGVPLLRPAMRHTKPCASFPLLCLSLNLSWPTSESSLLLGTPVHKPVGRKSRGRISWEERGVLGLSA
jgi:hypothetical protein